MYILKGIISITVYDWQVKDMAAWLLLLKLCYSKYWSTVLRADNFFVLEASHWTFRSGVSFLVHNCYCMKRSAIVDFLTEMSLRGNENKETLMATEHSTRKSQRFNSTPPLRATEMLSKIPRTQLHLWANNNRHECSWKTASLCVQVCCRVTIQKQPPPPPTPPLSFKTSILLVLTKATWRSFRALESLAPATHPTCVTHRPAGGWLAANL